jgi:hypothetical protein
MLIKVQGFMNTRSNIAFAGLVVVAAAANAQDKDVSAQVLNREDLNPRLVQATPPKVGTTQLNQQFDYNGISLVFNEGAFVDLPLQVGTSQDTVLRGGVTRVGSVKKEQLLDLSVGGQRLNTRQSAWIFQLNTMDRNRVVTTQLDETGDLLGFKLDFSATGKCFLPGSPIDGYCTYTPGLATIPDGVDPDTLTPSTFLVSSEFGQEIPQAVHQSLFSPEFQRGEDVPGGPLVGMSFDVLNSGFASDANPLSLIGNRDEKTRLRFVPTVAHVEQTLATNSVEAAATRTTRAFVLPSEREFDNVYLAMQLAAWALPSANGAVGYTDGAPNTSVSNNLFNALNNARVPTGSYTIFQTGRADVVHPTTSPRSAAETPIARYAGFWMGMSPVREVRVKQRLQFIPTGDRISVAAPAFSQGGFGSPFDAVTDAGITLIDEFDQSISSVNLQNVDDLFLQLGVDLTRQNAIRRITTTETTDTRLVPHLSFNGNRTGGETVLRYYAGLIFSDKTNGYVGSDFTLATESGWNAYARLDLYSAPDLDYRSEIELRGSRTFNLSPNRQFSVGLGGIMELDNQVLGNGNGAYKDEAQANIFGRWREGAFNFNLNQRFTRDQVGGSGKSTTLGFGYSPNEGTSVSAQISPLSTETSYIQAALGVRIKLDGFASAPVFEAQIARAKYEVGTSTFGSTTSAAQNLMRIGLQARF